MSDAPLRNHNNKSRNRLDRRSTSDIIIFSRLGLRKPNSSLAAVCAHNIPALSSLALSPSPSRSQARGIAEEYGSVFLLTILRSSDILPRGNFGCRSFCRLVHVLLVTRPLQPKKKKKNTVLRAKAFPDYRSALSINIFPACCCLVKQLPSNRRSIRPPFSSRSLADSKQHRGTASLVIQCKDFGSSTVSQIRCHHSTRQHTRCSTVRRGVPNLSGQTRLGRQQLRPLGA